MSAERNVSWEDYDLYVGLGWPEEDAFRRASTARWPNPSLLAGVDGEVGERPSFPVSSDERSEA